MMFVRTEFNRKKTMISSGALKASRKSWPLDSQRIGSYHKPTDNDKASLLFPKNVSFLLRAYIISISSSQRFDLEFSANHTLALENIFVSALIFKESVISAEKARMLSG